jgi:hypothetical protein
MSVTSYRDLAVWQRAMELAEEAYRLAKLMPKAEEYRLISQLVRGLCPSPPISPKATPDQADVNF